MQINAQIGNSTVARDRVLAWEDRRSRRVLKRMGLPIASTRSERRRALTDHKLSVGHDGLRKSPFASEFTVDYDDLSSLQSLPDPAFPHQVAGVARLRDGLAIGGVRHQFRQIGAGFQARLTVEFPIAMMGFMAAEHQWHLAAEFSNWIEAAFP